MPLPLLAAVAAPAATLWNYNRANFLYDSGQKVTRTYTSISYQMQQFQLYRQDIRDLVALTTEKMANYHVVACLELGMTATLLGPARLPDDVPEWVLWHQLVCLCSAFVFLVTSMWLATRAAVAAGSFNVRLQTQYIRLPLPDDEQLDGALTKADEFEGAELAGILRLPFLADLWNKFWGNKIAQDSEDSGLLDGAQQAPVAPPPSRPQPAVAVDAQGPGHLQLYQHLQRKWSCYDAYARITMSLGTFWLVLSLAYYEIGWNLCHLERGLPAVVAALMFAAVVVLLVYLDIFVSRAEMAGAAVLIFAGPVLVAIGAATTPKEASENPWYAFAADLAHIALSLWFWHIGRIVPGKDTLPSRWKGVAYLDIFGPIVKELKNLLDNTGLGHHAQAEEDHIDGDFSDLFDFVDKDRSGEITREEWDQAFDAIDTNHSGTITRQEWRQHHGQAAIFDVVDGNGNGAVSRSEWRAAFDTFDRDGDGTISCNEWYHDRKGTKAVTVADVSVSFNPAEDARIKNARGRLQAAIEDASGSTRRQRRLLNTAMQIAALVGMRVDDPQIKEAELILAQLEVPRDIRLVRQIVRDWREGEVYRHLDRKRRMDLDDLSKRIEDAAARLGLPAAGKLAPAPDQARALAKKTQPGCGLIGKPAQQQQEGLPTILRSLSTGSTASANYVPVWTRVTHHPEDGSQDYDYWCGTATAEGRWGFGEEAPPDARTQEYDDVRARCTTVLDRAELVITRRARLIEVGQSATSVGKPKLNRQESISSTCLLDDADIDGDDPADADPSGRKSKFRHGHQPVLAFRTMSLAMVGLWSLGFVVHVARWFDNTVFAERRLAFTMEPFEAIALGEATAEAPRLRGGTVAPATALAASFARPEEFFRPDSVHCPGGAGRGLAVFASNGFLVYALPPQLDNVRGFSRARLLECPVDQHDGLVATERGGDDACPVVVATGAGLWCCSSNSSLTVGATGAAAASGRPLLAVSQAYARGHAPLKLWAAADGRLSTVFAAPRRGPIVEFRRAGSALRPVAEIHVPAPPAGTGGASDEPLEWRALAVTANGLLVAVAEGPAVFAWSLATGRFVGRQALPAAAAGSEWLGWCLGEDQALYGLTQGVEDTGLELRRVAS